MLNLFQDLIIKTLKQVQGDASLPQILHQQLNSFSAS